MTARFSSAIAGFALQSATIFNRTFHRSKYKYVNPRPTPTLSCFVRVNGAVLYELLAGKPAFTGESAGGILATVVKDDPDWSSLPGETPSGCDGCRAAAWSKTGSSSSRRSARADRFGESRATQRDTRVATPNYRDCAISRVESPRRGLINFDALPERISEIHERLLSNVDHLKMAGDRIVENTLVACREGDANMASCGDKNSVDGITREHGWEASAFYSDRRCQCLKPDAWRSQGFVHPCAAVYRELDTRLDVQHRDFPNRHHGYQQRRFRGGLFEILSAD